VKDRSTIKAKNCFYQILRFKQPGNKISETTFAPLFGSLSTILRSWAQPCNKNTKRMKIFLSHKNGASKSITICCTGKLVSRFTHVKRCKTNLTSEMLTLENKYSGHVSALMFCAFLLFNVLSEMTPDPTLVPRPFSGLWFKFQASSPVFRALYPQSAHSSDYFVNLFDVSTGHQLASKVQLYGITSYVRSGKFLTFDFYASDMDFLWRLDRSSQTQ